LVSGTSKITDVGIEEREVLAQKRKGCIGATERTNAAAAITLSDARRCYIWARSEKMRGVR
jgi:hypothetical protein